ncbi:Ng-dimethylarginine dimethylaminohydrolase [Paragonimus heterotremus]|uniref:Ng-dimethylarginine dimethylaminohydrolase n=2 Tax=Paragonimus TaxID=34503 RepID=A0A8J4SR47_9TREM|nr:Ng-dimethylarginine dimethylaminohydrolase [Paragonimus heterotremus]
MAFQYAYAIVSKIPDSFEAYRVDKGNSASREWLENAHSECTEFVETLRRIGVDILELKAEERHPECVKVDDTAVIINGTALMCNPYGSHRQGEVNLIRQTLKKEVGVKVVELNTENAQVEGSDVLFTGQEIIVGLSNHTNEDGAQAVARAFPEYATCMVEVRAPYRSLKDAVGVAGINVLAVGESDAARAMLKDISKVVSHTYRIITLPEDHAANVLYVNHYLMHWSPKMIPKSIGVFENKIEYNRTPMHMPNLFTAGVPMTKMALFVGRFRHQRNIVSTIP